MRVITLGPGNVDLSIPATMTLAGAVSMKVMDGSDAMIVPGPSRSAAAPASACSTTG